MSCKSPEFILFVNPLMPPLVLIKKSWQNFCQAAVIPLNFMDLFSSSSLFTPKMVSIRSRISGVSLGATSAGFHVLVHLFHAAGAGDDRADIWILQTPGQRQVVRVCNPTRWRSAPSAWTIASFSLSVSMLMQPVVALECPTAAFGNALVIFSSQQARKPADSRSLFRTHIPYRRAHIHLRSDDARTGCRPVAR